MMVSSVLTAGVTTSLGSLGSTRRSPTRKRGLLRGRARREEDRAASLTERERERVRLAIISRRDDEDEESERLSDDDELILCLLWFHQYVEELPGELR